MPSLEMKPRILIICPSFPPNPGIGGRRWAKFAKILFQQGYDVWVFSFKLPNRNENSHWTKDVEELQKNNRIIEVDRNYPAILDEYPKSFIGKLKYKFWDNYLKVRHKGNTYDRSLRWGEKLIKAIEEKINHQPIKIIATGAPFRYLFKLVYLKKYPNVSLIADFRDPWANNETFFMKHLGNERKIFEADLESLVVHSFDKLICVDDVHSLYFKNNYQIPEKKIQIVRNGFDILESKKELYNRAKRSSIDYIFGGSLYNGTEVYLISFANVLLEMKEKLPEIFKLLKFYFFTEIPIGLEKIIEKLNGTLHFLNEIPLLEFQKKVARSDYSLVFLTNQFNYTFNTKFLEAINQGNKVLVFSSKGYLEKYVSENNLGYSMTEGEMKKSLLKTVEDWQTCNNRINNLPEELNKLEINNLTELIKGNVFEKL